MRYIFLLFIVIVKASHAVDFKETASAKSIGENVAYTVSSVIDSGKSLKLDADIVINAAVKEAVKEVQDSLVVSDDAFLDVSKKLFTNKLQPLFKEYYEVIGFVSASSVDAYNDKFIDDIKSNVSNNFIELHNSTKGCELFGDAECILFNPGSFRFDNDDLFSSSSEDRNYTYGLFWSWGNDKARKHVLHTETIQHFLFKTTGLNKSPYKDDYLFQFGITNFTPGNISETDVVENDRPYASLIYVHSDVYKIINSDISTGIGTTFGVLGTSVGGALQAGWHSLLRELLDDDKPVNPNGWHNQVSDGGELTGKIDFSYHRRFSFSETQKNFDAAWFADMSLGYYTSASIGGVVKLGQVNEEIAPHYLSKLSVPVSAGSYLAKNDEGEREREREGFIFLGIRQVFMGYNALLECQFKSSAHCLNSDQVETSFTEWSYGFKSQFFRFWDIGDGTNIVLSIHGRTAEHKLETKRKHTWGSIMFEWTI